MSNGPRVSTKSQRANRDTISYGLRAIQSLLRAYSRGARDLNLSHVQRDLERYAALYAQLEGRLGPFQEEVISLMDEVTDYVEEFQFPEPANPTNVIFAAAQRAKESESDGP